MIRLTQDQFSPAVRALFQQVDLPAGLRCQGVLDGCFPGVVFTDDPLQPTWAVVNEQVYGTLYPVGAIHGEILRLLVDDLRQSGDVLIGLWPGDPLVNSLPTAPQYEGRVLDYTDRPMGEGLEALLQPIPEGYAVCPMNAVLLEQSPWYRDRLKTYGSVETVLAKEIGFCLVRGDMLLSEASAGPVAGGVMEVGVVTLESYRGRGYATLVAAHTVRACEARGFQTYWNCNTENLPSVALGRKLGYRSIREYRLFGWFRPG